MTDLGNAVDHAVWTGAAGDLPGARDLLAALLPVAGRVQGVEHPVSQSTRRNLAYWTRTAQRR